MDRLRRPLGARESETAPKLSEVRGRNHVAFDPIGKALTLARDLVPSLIEGIVASVIAG
jgi:hypothetical protein